MIFFGPCTIRIHLRLPNHVLDSTLGASIRKIPCWCLDESFPLIQFTWITGSPSMKMINQPISFSFHLWTRIVLNTLSCSPNVCWCDDTILPFGCGFGVTQNTCVWKVAVTARHGHTLPLRGVRSWCWPEFITFLNEWGWIQSADLDWKASDTGCVKQNKMK